MRRTSSLRLVTRIAAAAVVLTACGNTPSSTAPTSAPTAATSATGGTAGSTAEAGDCAPITPEAAGSSPVATSSEAAATEPATGGSADLTVGLAYDTGGRGDGTFNDAAAQGLDRAKSELGVAANELEAATDDDRTPNLTLLSTQGNDPIIAVGFLWTDTVAAIAPQYPDQTFAIIDSVVEQPNVKSLIFAEEQGSFLVGAAAAMKTETCQLGFIGGQEGELIKRFEAGFTAGAKAVRPDIEIDVQYLGPVGDNTAWASPDKAKEIAKSWYAGGVDIIYTAAGGSGSGTIEAAVEDGKWAIGVDLDQYLTVAPEQQAVILTSMIKRVDEAVYQTIEQVANGQTEGGITVFNLENNGVGYATSGGYIDDLVPALEGYKQQIISGEITVPTDPSQIQ